MDTACVYDEKTVVHELTQGLQMAQQLRANLHSPKARDTLIQKILSSYDNTLFILRAGYSSGQLPSLPESSLSFRIPGSEEFMFDQPFSGQQGERIISRKRKGSPAWKDQVITWSDNGLDGDTNDGFSWRKYGQKDIQGAKFRRSYYRCSYSDTQKCFATKQVQRRDEDPNVFDIKYKGEHTCNHGAQWDSPSSSSLPPPSRPPKSPPSPEQLEIMPTHHQLSPPTPGDNLSNLIANLSVNTLDLGSDGNTSFHQLSPPTSGEALSNLRANLNVNTLDLGGDGNTSFSFPSASSGVMEDFPNFYDDELLPIFSPPYISPVTSESNMFTDWGNSQSLDNLAGIANLHTDFDFNKTLF